MLKKIAIVLLFVLPISLMAQEVKLGHINIQEIFSIMPERVGLESSLSELQTQYEKEIGKMGEELNIKLKEYQDKQSTMPESIKQARETEIQEIQQRIQTFRQTVSSDLQKKQQELSSPIIEKINKAIKEVASEGKYLYIFNYIPDVFLYQSPNSNDITLQVKKKLGLSEKKTAEIKK